MTAALAHASPHCIELRGVSKTYAGTSVPVSVLHDVSLTIDQGEFVAIVGPSGSGKSTLMNILGCLDRPSTGSYRFAGKEVALCRSDELARLRREIFGFVFQQYQLVSALTAAENVEVPAIYRGLPAPQRHTRVAQLLKRFGLSQRGHHHPEQLSGGQQQRVSIARALMNGGRVLLADEPTGALDRASGQDVMNVLRELSDAGHTIILVTHDRSVASQARRVIELSDGRVVADSGSEPLERTPASQPSAAGEQRAGLTVGFREALRAARQALSSDWGRTLLTLLGIIVGVAAVVVLLAVGEGTKRAVVRQLEAFGTNRLYVTPRSDDRKLGGVVTEADAQLVSQIPHVVAAMPFLTGTVVVRYGNVDHRTSGSAVTTAFPRILHWKTERGAFFTRADERSLATVALLGKKLTSRLFPDGSSPLRKFVLVENVPFQVIGVLEGKGALTGDTDDDDNIVFPFSTGSKRIFGTPNASWISVTLDDARNADRAVHQIETTLTAAHHVKDFDVFNKAASVAAQAETLEIMTSLLLVTAIVSLIVGGIGVMNVMLMTVAERTGEIGIRMAVGASQRHVLTQFLTEAVVLAGVGGAIGLLLGFGVGFVCRALDQEVVFTLPASLLALSCALVTGIVCGYLPARRAASMDPVVALARR